VQHNGTAFGFAGHVINSATQLPIVVEILDPRTQRTVTDSTTAGLSQVSDFMNSNDLVSKILAMVSEDAKVKGILDQLLGGYGTQFAVVPSEQVVQPGALVSFQELAAHCSQMRRSILCGVIEAPAANRGSPECVLNPPNKTAPRAWTGCGLVLIVADLVARPSSVATSPNTPAAASAAGTPTSTLSRVASLRVMADVEHPECFEFATPTVER
jgi:hypothetical protein